MREIPVMPILVTPKAIKGLSATTREFIRPWGPAMVLLGGIFLLAGNYWFDRQQGGVAALFWALSGLSFAAAVYVFVWGFRLAQKKEAEDAKRV